MTSLIDPYEFYGIYIRKANPVVFATLARMLEMERNENSARMQFAEGEIQRAHEILDKLGVPRLQTSGFPYSLEGRLRSLTKLVEV